MIYKETDDGLTYVYFEIFWKWLNKIFQTPKFWPKSHRGTARQRPPMQDLEHHFSYEAVQWLKWKHFSRKLSFMEQKIFSPPGGARTKFYFLNRRFKN